MAVRKKRRVRVQGQQTCPLCREAIRGDEGDEALGVCPACETVYHDGCLEQLGDGGCATLGCRRQRRARGRTRGAQPLAETVEAGWRRSWALPAAAAAGLFVLMLAFSLQAPNSTYHLRYQSCIPCSSRGFPFGYVVWEDRFLRHVSAVGVVANVFVCALLAAGGGLGLRRVLRPAPEPDDLGSGDDGPPAKAP